MRQNPSRRKPLDPDEVWQNFSARDELENQVEQARPKLKSLAEAFARAEVFPNDPPDVCRVVEEVHVKRAADVLYALADQPEIYAKTGSPELFISFANPQQAEVRAWAEHLKTASFRCFFSDESVDYSKAWADEIWHAVRVCCCFMPVVTPEWIRSRWCMYETGAAVAFNKPILPILIGDVDAPPPVSDCKGFKLGHVADLIDLPAKQKSLWHRVRRDLRRLCYRKDTVLFLGVWEGMHNPDFNSLEFEGIRNDAGRNSFFLSKATCGNMPASSSCSCSPTLKG